MATRREFIRLLGLGGLAFGAGLGLGGVQPGNSRILPGLIAHLPASPQQFPELEAWLPGLRCEALPGPLGCDLALSRGSRLLDPAEWPRELLGLRRRLQGEQATWRVTWQAGGAPREADRLWITDARGHCQEYKLAGFGQQRVIGRDGHELLLEQSTCGLRVLRADCRQGICREQAPAVMVGERIVCAPSGLLLELTA